MGDNDPGWGGGVCVAEGQPFGRRTALRSDRLLDLGGTEYECRDIRFCILELQVIPFTSGVVLPAIPQSEDDLESWGGKGRRTVW
jgi:hypothetical protein